MPEPFARLQSVEARQLEVLEVFVEAAHSGQPQRVRRRFPLFVTATARAVLLGHRLCLVCRRQIHRLGVRGPLAVHCSIRCAKHGYNFSDRKRATRAAWAKARRSRLRAAGKCLGCEGRSSFAYCGTCRAKRRADG